MLFLFHDPHCYFKSQAIKSVLTNFFDLLCNRLQQLQQALPEEEYQVPMLSASVTECLLHNNLLEILFSSAVKHTICPETTKKAYLAFSKGNAEEVELILNNQEDDPIPGVLLENFVPSPVLKDICLSSN